MNPSPASAVFFSCVRSWGWGAPDYIWPIAARHLLDRGIPVAAVVEPSTRTREEIRSLQSRGAVILGQPRVNYSGGWQGTMRQWAGHFQADHRRLLSQIRHMQRPHVFVNQGGTYDILYEKTLLQAIQSSGASYDLFVHSNNPVPPLSQALRDQARLLFSRARRVFFNSTWVRELTETQLLCPIENAAPFTYSIRFPHDAPLPWPEEDGRPIVKWAAVCRMDAHHKGLDALLQALALLPAHLPAWHLDLYGEGPDKDYLQKMAIYLHLEDRVSFHSHTSDIPGIWRTHHLLILPSRYEGLGVAMLEAMACGRPVLRTPYGGCDEWMVPGETGWICPAAEPSLLAQTLTEVLQSPGTLPAMGQRAFQRIRDFLQPDPWSVYLQPFEP